MLILCLWNIDRMQMDVSEVTGAMHFKFTSPSSFAMYMITV